MSSPFIIRKASAIAVLMIVPFCMSKAGQSPSINDLKELDGEWVFFEDRTPERPLEQLGPPMSSKFSFRIEEGAVILASGHGSGQRDVRVFLDGKVTEAMDKTTIIRYTGSWKDGAFSYQSNYFRGPDKTPDGFIKKEFRMTPDGLLVRVVTHRTEGEGSIGLYRHPQDIPMPTPAKATIGDMAWLAGAWAGTRGTNGAIAFEERWTPPKGGSMLATSRTVSRERMSAFEFLRIVERDGGLVYIAQPNGAPPTEFVLSELVGKKAVFENPRHDYPNKIVYELTDAGLTATIGQTKGGTPRRFEFKRDGG